MGGHICAAAVRALLQGKPCTKPHQALLIQLVQQIYCRLCLGITPVGDTVAQQAAAAAGGQSTTAAPRGVLAQLCGASAAEIAEFERQVLATRSDKDHKALFKNFLRSLVPRATGSVGGAGGEGGGGRDDALRNPLPIIQDLGEKLVVFSSRRLARAASAEKAVGVGGGGGVGGGLMSGGGGAGGVYAGLQALFG